MSWYKTGAVSVTNGSNAVTGVDTAFVINVMPGDIFTIDKSRMYEIYSVPSDTSLILMEPYQESTASNIAYAIIINFTYTMNARLAQRVANLIATYEDWTIGTFPGVFETDANGDFMPKEDFEPDALFEADANGDLMPIASGG